MVLKDTVILLDLHKITLLAVQPTISEQGLKKKIEDIDKGVEFDPVNVAEVKSSVYRLIHEGHHISRAHYDKDKLLGCNIVCGEKLYCRWRSPIQDIIVI